MSDPIYEFIKGQGWQVSNGQVTWYCDITFFEGVHRKITVIDRIPKPGERGWAVWGDHKIDSVWMDITQNCRRVTPGWPVSTTINMIEGRRVYTVEVERLTKDGWQREG